MQLTRALALLILVSLLAGMALADEPDLVDEPVQIDILNEYYRQDGDHAAVTGGEGTQELDNIAPMVIIHLPVRDRMLTVAGGFDLYSSASTDRIDYVMSSASSSDLRGHLDLTWATDDPARQHNWGITGGWSGEFDYQSVHIGGHYGLLSADRNRELNVSGKFYFDTIKLIYPYELRSTLPDGMSPGTDSRTTLSGTLTWNQVLSTRAQGSLSVDLVRQSGFLSTSFHRVYFPGFAMPRIEHLPDTRLKYPVSLRFNYYLHERVIVRLHGRAYQDDWNVRALSLTAETPLRFTPSFALIPFYRYHDQQEADFFAPYRSHDPADEFYTSDWDLAAFTSNKLGMGLRYYPMESLFGAGLPGIADELHLKRIDLRVSSYQRSDGLTAFAITTGFGFELR